jgi:hypothetical protein
MEIKIDIENYLSEEEIKEICKDTMRGIIREQFRKEADVDRVISNLSYEFLFKQISESIGEDAVALIKSKVNKLLQDSTSIEYELFRKADAWERSESVGYTILKQAIKDNADLINERVKETISVYDFGNREEIKEAIEDSVHSYIAEKLFNEE